MGKSMFLSFLFFLYAQFNLCSMPGDQFLCGKHGNGVGLFVNTARKKDDVDDAVSSC